MAGKFSTETQTRGIRLDKTLIFTILIYSDFTALTALASEAWHIEVLRFLVAMGV